MQTLSGIVIHGNKIGRELGFPTANIACKSNEIENSVFHINVVIDEKIYRGMGAHMVHKGVFEAHIFDFNQDIYDKEIEVILLQKIRDNKKFDGPIELKKQIMRDKTLIESQRLNVLTFGSFDVLHLGHKYYLSQARKYGTHLITIVATDGNIEKIKGKAPMYGVLERTDAIIETGIPHEVIAGSDVDPMQWLRKYKPHCICLGYDQRGKFVEALPEKLKELGIETHIMRVSAHMPEIYKSSLLKENKNS